MDNSVSSLQEISKAAKKAKSKKKKKKNNKPIKVVYISNPMKVKTSASKFRALVQELTGQDAELPDPTKFTNNPYDVDGANQTVPDAAENSTDDHAQQVSRVEENNQTVPDAAENSTDDHPQEVSRVEENNQTVPDAAENSINDHAQEVSGVGEQPAGHHHHHEQQYYTKGHDHDVPFETLDEVFTPQMLENFTGFLPPGLLL